MRLLCFAPPDADPAVYSQWPAAFPPDLEVCPLPWPAAHAGQAPALLPDWHARVERVAEEVMDLLDRPFALFGYGNAGLLALAVAQTIRDRFGLSPSCLFVAAACPPEHVELPEAAGSEEANASEWFSRRLSTPLDCPLTALAGAGNERLGGDTMLGWRNWTQGSFRLEVLPGDFAAHLESPEQLARIVQHDLVQAVLP
jgi:medium-chain acyl-[acyl-carrier-protein] hydrolase